MTIGRGGRLCDPILSFAEANEKDGATIPVTFCKPALRAGQETGATSCVSFTNFPRALRASGELFVEHGQAGAGFGAEPLAGPDGEQEGDADDDERREPGNLREPECERSDPVERADVIR